MKDRRGVAEVRPWPGGTQALSTPSSPSLKTLWQQEGGHPVSCLSFATRKSFLVSDLRPSCCTLSMFPVAFSGEQL